MGGNRGTRFSVRDILDSSTRSMGYKKFLSILKPYFIPRNWVDRIRAFACFACLGAAKASSILGPVYLGRATDSLGANDFPVKSLILFCFLGFGSKAFNELQRIIYLRVKEIANVELAETSFAHVQQLSLNWHLTKKSGVVLRAMDRGVTSASNVVDMLFLRLVPTFVELLVLVVIFATTLQAPWPALALFCGFSVYIIITFLLTRWRRKIRTRRNRVDNEANQKAVEALTNFETVKYFTNEGYELNRYSDAMARFMKANKETQYSLGALNVLQEFIIKATQCAVLLLAALQVIDGDASVGDFVTINAYVVQVFTPLSFLGTIYSTIINSYTDMTNLADLLEEKPDVVDKSDALRFSIDPSKGAEIEFKDVWFKYPATVSWQKQMYIACVAASLPSTVRLRLEMQRGTIVDSKDAARFGEDTEGKQEAASQPEKQIAQENSSKEDIEKRPLTDNVDVQVDGEEETVEEERYVLKGISFKVPTGTTTAIVGETGAGKSTISRLLFRFFDVSQGQILINGYDVRDMTQKSLREALGKYEKEPGLDDMTAEYNIQYGKPGMSREVVEQAVRDAALQPFVRQLPDGLDTLVGERGLKLSGGEKQRVAIARTLLKDPPILILDEATSSLDSKTEAEIQEAISRVRTGRTVMIIAHRLSTIKDADNILVLDQGNIVESGNHSELLEKDGYYAALWQQQMYGTRQQETEDEEV